MFLSLRCVWTFNHFIIVCGIMIFICDDIPSRVLTKHVFPDDIEGLFIELNFRKAKWLLFGTYHPPIQSGSYYFQ